ncbi:hypothetical protein [Paenibacillus sp. sgz5001063]
MNSSLGLQRLAWRTWVICSNEMMHLSRAVILFGQHDGGYSRFTVIYS